MAPSRQIPDYQNFELLIGAATPNGYPLTVTQSPAGEGTTYCNLDPTDAELQDALAAVSGRDTDAAFIAQLGEFLFAELFARKVGELYRTSLGIIRSQGQRLRVRLRIEPPEVAALPWEFLYDSQEESALAITPESALVRYIPLRLPVRPSTVALPLRLLVVLSSPVDLPTLNVAEERRLIEEALSERVAKQEVKLEFLVAATIADIQQALRSFQPHVFHFVGHGTFVDGGAQIILEDESKHGLPVDERTFRELFGGSSETRVAVLNACQSGSTSSSQPLVGLAPRLLQRQLSAVVAMQYPVTDQAGLVFAREFYRSLAAGLPVDAAVGEARRGIWLELGADRPDWGAPVLFLRAADGQLFVVEENAPPAMDVAPPPEPAHPPTLEVFVGREPELAFFAAQLQQHGAAIIAGMPGVGKTTLAAALAQQAGTPAKTFWHTFHPDEGLEVSIWKLAGFLYWNEQPGLWQMLQGIRQGGGQLPPLDLLLDYLFQMASGHGYLICLDDFQCVETDPLFGALVTRLQAALQAQKITVIITSRRIPDFVSLTDFKALTGLNREEVDKLLAAREVVLEPDMVATLYRYTEGNVELLTIALNALVRAADPKRMIARLVDTEDIERYLLHELDDSLTTLERLIETVVALLGQASVRQLIERTLAQGDLRRHLHDLSERFLLTVYASDWERKYDQHAILRAFYRDLVDGEQSNTMHRRAAAYYEEVEQAWLLAAEHYLNAGDDERAATLATQHVWELINSGQARALRRLLERFTAQRLTPECWVDVLLARGQIYNLLGEHDLAQSSYITAYDLLDGMVNSASTHERRALACQGMGEVLRSSQLQEALVWLQRGLDEYSVAKGQPQQVALLHVLIGGVYEALGEYDVARDTIEKALAMLPTTPSSVRASALLNLSNIYSMQGLAEQTSIATLEALAISRQLHDYFLIVLLLGNLGIDKRVAGDWPGALAHYEEALALANEQGNVAEQIRIKNSLGLLLTQMGDLQQAHDILVDAITAARQHRLTENLLYALTSFAELLIRLDDWQSVNEVLNEAEQLALSTDFKYPLAAIYYSWAQAYLARQEMAPALDYAERAVQTARQLDLGDQEGVALRVLAQVQAAAGEIALAEQSFAQSLERLAGVDPYEAARTHAAWGTLLIRDGRLEAGKEKLQRAQATFTELGAQRDLAQLPAGSAEHV